MLLFVVFLFLLVIDRSFPGWSLALSWLVVVWWKVRMEDLPLLALVFGVVTDIVVARPLGTSVAYFLVLTAMVYFLRQRFSQTAFWLVMGSGLVAFVGSWGVWTVPISLGRLLVGLALLAFWWWIVSRKTGGSGTQAVYLRQ